MNPQWRPPTVVKQRCVTCGGSYDREVAFRKNRHIRGSRALDPDTRATCIGCEQTERDSHKAVDAFMAKARGTIQRHAHRYHMTAPEFAKSYGWDVPRVAHILRHAFDNTCAYCRQPYSAMRNGPNDVTMDIIDPAKEPYLETNTQPCCGTCNTSKSNSSPELWARKLRFWREWEDNQLHVEAKVQLELALA
jgi:hypothetical protein